VKSMKTARGMRRSVSWLQRVLLTRLSAASMRTIAGARSRNARHRVQRYFALLTGAVVLASACSDKADPSTPQPQPQPQPQPVATVVVAPAALELKVGDARQIAATPQDAQGRTLQKAVTWRSSDAAIATVDNSGSVRALSGGSAVITAAADGIEGKATVTVTAVAGELESSRDTLHFAGIAGILTPAPQPVQLTARHAAVGGLVAEVTYSPASGGGWLTAVLTAPAAPAQVNVTAVTGILFPGTYRAQVTIRSLTQPEVAPKRIEVIFDVQPGPEMNISASDRHSCGVDLAGRVSCWGYNAQRQLGVGSLNNHEASAVQLPGANRYLRISTGEQHGCGITIEGEAYCWGTGFMGDGNQASAQSPRLVAGGYRWTHIAAGYRHTCGIATDGETYCWGTNHGGQLGNGTRTERSLPTKVATTARFTALTAGEEHTCGVTSNGDAYCWGRTAYGRLGRLSTSTDAELTPVLIGGGRQWSSLSAGQLHTCGVTRAGDAFCWGYNGSGQLGDDSRTTRTAPTELPSDVRFSTIAAGRNHTCAVSVAGQAYCWGYRQHGGVGDGGSTGYALVPAQVLGGIRFKRITAANNHSCGISLNDEAYCWGYNALGAIGDGTTADRLQPVKIEM
jgi:alpha-tubulin suppressor-like RCC1 family protein